MFPGFYPRRCQHNSNPVSSIKQQIIAHKGTRHFFVLVPNPLPKLGILGRDRTREMLRGNPKITGSSNPPPPLPPTQCPSLQGSYIIMSFSFLKDRRLSEVNSLFKQVDERRKVRTCACKVQEQSSPVIMDAIETRKLCQYLMG